MSASPSPEPGWFRWFSHQVIRLGPMRATAALTVIVWLLAMAISQGVISVTGHGNRAIATLSSSLCWRR